ncbi:hypothetical protein AcV5_010390 [Taiwanofungus camphoratus]|nr:hypothetical protein AcV5_010390 [Antrodia cinnamomea]
MSDIESFFSEQEERMEMPNEDFEEYLSRTSQKHALYRVDNRRTSSLITAAAPVPHAAQIGRDPVTCSLPLTGSMGPCVAPTSPDTVIMDERTISSSVKRKLSEIISTSSDAVKRPKVVRGHEDTVCNPSAQIQDDSEG